MRRRDFLRISVMVVFSNTEREPRRALVVRTEGLECWNPAAPAIGLNSVRMDGNTNKQLRISKGMQERRYKGIRALLKLNAASEILM